jgi:hypothetical protein
MLLYISSTIKKVRTIPWMIIFINLLKAMFTHIINGRDWSIINIFLDRGTRWMSVVVVQKLEQRPRGSRSIILVIVCCCKCLRVVLLLLRYGWGWSHKESKGVFLCKVSFLLLHKGGWGHKGRALEEAHRGEFTQGWFLVRVGGCLEAGVNWSWLRG